MNGLFLLDGFALMDDSKEKIARNASHSLTGPADDTVVRAIKRCIPWCCMLVTVAHIIIIMQHDNRQRANEQLEAAVLLEATSCQAATSYVPTSYLPAKQEVVDLGRYNKLCYRKVAPF